MRGARAGVHRGTTTSKTIEQRQRGNRATRGGRPSICGQLKSSPHTKNVVDDSTTEFVPLTKKENLSRVVKHVDILRHRAHRSGLTLTYNLVQDATKQENAPRIA